MASRGRPEQPAEAAITPARVELSEPELEAFYRGVFLPLVRRATWKHGLSKEDASDIVQDAFLLALGKIDMAGNPKSWLIQVVDHLALNYRRKNLRRSQLISRWGVGRDSELTIASPKLPEY
jgi:DNA-directed RNA polymerase specialized sigma24 family protein